VLFNDRSNDYFLNQLYLFIERPILADGSGWDIGGRIDVNYGTDSRFITVPGLERHRDDTPKWNSETDRYGMAIPQAFIEVLHFRGSRGEGNQVLEERPQFAVVAAATQSGQELFSQHFSGNRTSPVRVRGATVLVVPRTITAVTQFRLVHVPTI